MTIEMGAQCFYCGKCMNPDEQYEAMVVVNYVPCKKCMEVFNTGFMILSVSTKPNVEDQVELPFGSGKVYPTGGYVVITKEASQTLFADQFKGQKADNKAVMHDDEFDNFVNDLHEIIEGGILDDTDVIVERRN
jgi:hypothetical protein